MADPCETFLLICQKDPGSLSHLYLQDSDKLQLTPPQASNAIVKARLQPLRSVQRLGKIKFA